MPLEAVKPGCTLHDLLERKAAAGTFVGDIDGFIAALKDESIAKIDTDLPDGRSIRIVNRKMSNSMPISVDRSDWRKRPRNKYCASTPNYEKRVEERTAELHAGQELIVAERMRALFEEKDRERNTPLNTALDNMLHGLMVLRQK